MLVGRNKRHDADVPLFMKEERTARLMRHAPPFGFDFGAGAKTFTLDALHAMRRNATLPSTRRFRSCAVVGSSGNLRGRNLGAEIDAHDAVIRVNGAPLGPLHSTTVGDRTTWRVYASPRSASATRFIDETGDTLLVLCNREYIYSCQNVMYSESKPHVHGLNLRARGSTLTPARCRVAVEPLGSAPER